LRGNIAICKTNKTKNGLKGWIEMKTNLKDRVKKTMVLGLGLLMVIGALGTSGVTAFAAEADYGAAGASSDDSYTLEEMLTYAIEDEYLAKAEYEKIMEEYGQQRPFTNIMEAEETHIELLLPLFEAYGIDVASDDSTDYLVIPESVEEALKVGVQAEIDNIAMYEKFLAGDLPEDVREVFEELMNASKNHLSAFERGTSRNAGTGEGNRAGGNSNGLAGSGSGEMAEMRQNGNRPSSGEGNGFAYGDREGSGIENKPLDGSGYGQGQGFGNGSGYGLRNGLVRAGRGR